MLPSLEIVNNIEKTTPIYRNELVSREGDSKNSEDFLGAFKNIFLCKRSVRDVSYEKLEFR